MTNLAQEVLAALPASVREGILQKAAEINSTYTWDPAARSVFQPEPMSEEIKYLVPTSTPLRNRLPRVPGQGQSARWDKLTSKLHHKNSSTAGQGTLSTVAFADAGTPGETAQTYAVALAAFKLLGRKVEIGGMAQKGSTAPGGKNMLESRERTKMYEVMLGEEELLIGGDSAYDANEFDGLLKQITTNSGSASVLSVSGIGGYCQTLADTYGAYPNLLLANGFQLINLSNQLQGSGSINRISVAPDGTAVGGVRLKAITNPLPGGGMIECAHNRYMGNNALLLTLASEAGEPWIEIEDLIPMSRIDVPSTSFSYVRFVLEAMVLKVMGEVFQYKIQGLATS